MYVCACVCVCVYIYIYIYIYDVVFQGFKSAAMDIYAHKYIHTHICIHTYIYTRIGVDYDVHKLVEEDPVVAAIHANAVAWDPDTEYVYGFLQVHECMYMCVYVKSLVCCIVCVYVLCVCVLIQSMCMNSSL